jgi:hypothetical protein
MTAPVIIASSERNFGRQKCFKLHCQDYISELVLFLYPMRVDILFYSEALLVSLKVIN